MKKNIALAALAMSTLFFAYAGRVSRKEAMSYVEGLDEEIEAFQLLTPIFSSEAFKELIKADYPNQIGYKDISKSEIQRVFHEINSERGKRVWNVTLFKSDDLYFRALIHYSVGIRSIDISIDLNQNEYHEFLEKGNYNLFYSHPELRRIDSGIPRWGPNVFVRVGGIRAG